MIRISSTILCLLFFKGLFSQGNPIIEPNLEKIFKDFYSQKTSFEMPPKSFPDLEDFRGNRKSGISIYRVDMLKIRHENTYRLVFTLPKINMPQPNHIPEHQVMPRNPYNPFMFMTNTNERPNWLQLNDYIFERTGFNLKRKSK